MVLPQIEGDARQYIILIDDLIRHRMHYIFNIFDYKDIEAHMIKVTLDAELDMELDLKKSLLEKIIIAFELILKKLFHYKKLT